MSSQADKTLNLHMDGNAVPNRDGDNQMRVVTVSGDELKVIHATAAPGGPAYSGSKRAK